MRCLCGKAEIRIAPLWLYLHTLTHCRYGDKKMLDLVYVGLGAFLFVLMGLYARACGRL